MTARSKVDEVRLDRLGRADAAVRIQGLSPLIVNRWTEKARQMMLEAQQTKARKQKDPKDPEALFEASKYKLEDGRDGIPSVAFKAAIVNAASLFGKSVTKVGAKQSLFVAGDGLDDRGDMLVALEYKECIRREDTPRNANGNPDLRYRAQYNGWGATLSVVYVESVWDLNSVIAMVDAAGLGGVGEWRPSAPKSYTGSYGTFEVV